MSQGPFLNGRRVLVVEDRYLIASEIADQVRALGGEVLGPARDADTGLGLLGQGRVDLALLDVNLGGSFVFPLAEALAVNDVPFAFLTGYDDALLPETWRDRPLLPKPVHPRRLRELLESLMQRGPSPG